ncbi:MAG: hypothetical protein FWE50_01660 [Alphaproteobacteria bacterium]|nr:hypothetical protein [Alphaproteobacteria bacterium]
MKRDLAYRKRQIDREKSALSFSAVQNYALRFRNHTLEFFKKSKKRLDEALSWKKLDFGARLAHFKKLVKHALSFGGNDYYDVEVKHAKSDGNTLGSTDGNCINVYDKLLKNDNYDKVVEVAKHEPAHVFQIRKGDTTLSHSTVIRSIENYVHAQEDYAYYRANPIEQEAWKIGQTASENFTKTLRDMQNGYQRAA